MITVLTTAKPFAGAHRISQINAIRSWKALAPDVEVILFGEGEGYAEAAEELDLVHVPDVQTSSQGTPLINAMFAAARKWGRYPVQAYINCDIIVLGGLSQALEAVKPTRFLIVGQRWDLDLNEPIDFDDPSWRAGLRTRIEAAGVLHPPYGSDYFVYREDIWDKLPPLIVGRVGIDNELIYHCRAAGVPVYDASEVITVIHQNHDYRHLPRGEHGIRTDPEALANRQPAVQRAFSCNLLDADWRLTEKGARRNFCRGNWKRYLEVLYRLRRGTLTGALLGAGLFLFRTFSRQGRSPQ